MANKCYVYQHKFPNGKIYFGITKQDPKKRWGCGCNYSNNERMTNAIKKYGWDNIEHKVLYEYDTLEEAEQKEIELIKEYKTDLRKFGYNVCLGGKGALGYRHTEETKEKIRARAKMKRKPLTKEHIQIIIKNKTGANNPNFGKPRTPETKEKIRQALIGKKRTPEQKLRLYGKHKNTIFIEYNGEKLTICQWAEKLGIPRQRLYARYKLNMPIERMFSKEKFINGYK